MVNLNSDKDYSKYTFDDFLQDDFFILSIVKPEDKSSEFWDNLLKEHKINEGEFLSAKRFLVNSIEENNNYNIELELSELWQDIQNTNRNNDDKRRYLKKRVYIAISVAACIAILFMGIPHLFVKPEIQKSEDLMSFVQKNSVQMDKISDIQLVLSDDKTVLLKEKESDITYDSTQIKISSNEEVLEKEPTLIYHQLVVPKGKRSTLKLSDGTILYVNAGTVVSYPSEFDKDKREIYIDGEAFLDVHHDANRPFIVKTSDVDIQVLGTKFNVMAYSSDVDKQIVLASGSVKVLSKDNTQKNLILKPSEMFQYNKDKQSGSILKVDIIKYTAWVNGLYYFESEKLDVVMKRLSRYYGQNISFDGNIANLRCSGKMDLKDSLTDVLHGLSFSFPINVGYNNGEYKITKKYM